MPAKLTPVSSGVVHSTAHRTRLKVPREHRTAQSAKTIKDAVERVPGVQGVHVNADTGNVVVEHDSRPDIIESIGDAIARVAPEILAVLTESTRGQGIGLGGLSAIGAVLGPILNR